MNLSIDTSKLYINGAWVDSESNETIDVLNPANEEVITQIPHANHEDVDKAVAAAKSAFPSWNALPVKERANYLSQLADAIDESTDELIDVIIEELGSAREFTKNSQVGRTAQEIRGIINNLDQFEFVEEHAGYNVLKEGFGVVAAITPWNYPLNQIQRKIAPALIAGNTVVVKPASNTPLTGFLLTRLIDEIGFPKGVFNFLTGSGSDTGDYLAGHDDVSVISFTGSTEVGKGLYEKASHRVKKLVLELGGKSVMLYLEGGDLEKAIKLSMDTVLNNTGQTCSALTRLLIPESHSNEAKEIIKAYYEERALTGQPREEKTVVGPAVSKDQQERIYDYIDKGVAEGATLFLGGKRLDGKGYFVQPTVFTEVTNDMTIAQEEIFGPVLTVITYKDVEEAVEIANDSNYGLSGAVVGPAEEAYEIASRLRTGNIIVNGAPRPADALFGGYKESGLGREVGLWGLADYLEEKAIFFEQ